MFAMPFGISTVCNPTSSHLPGVHYLAVAIVFSGKRTISGFLDWQIAQETRNFQTLVMNVKTANSLVKETANGKKQTEFSHGVVTLPGI